MKLSEFQSTPHSMNEANWCGLAVFDGAPPFQSTPHSMNEANPFLESKTECPVVSIHASLNE